MIAKNSALRPLRRQLAKVRPATDDERETWREALDAETADGKLIDPQWQATGTLSTSI
jgi:chitodextrinase